MVVLLGRQLIHMVIQGGGGGGGGLWRRCPYSSRGGGSRRWWPNRGGGEAELVVIFGTSVYIGEESVGGMDPEELLGSGGFLVRGDYVRVEAPSHPAVGHLDIGCGRGLRDLQHLVKCVVSIGGGAPDLEGLNVGSGGMAGGANRSWAEVGWIGG